MLFIIVVFLIDFTENGLNFRELHGVAPIDDNIFNN